MEDIQFLKMKMNKLYILILIPVITSLSTISATAQSLPSKEETLAKMRLANAYFMQKWPDTGKRIVTNISRASNIWTRAVYYEGLMALYAIDKKPEYYKYAIDWANFHKWDLRDGGTYTRNADNQCAGQTYIELYQIDPQPERIKYIKISMDSMMRTAKVDDWNWIDAIQMGMPIFSKLGVVYKDDAYFTRMHQMYLFTKEKHGSNGLYNRKEGLWWRDADFDPPYKEPNGEDCYWSRGNGWVIMAMARVLDVLPTAEPHRKEYTKMLQSMAKALAKVQRADGFWNVSLHDPTHFGGKETSGTAMFVYGMAWGINNGVLSEKSISLL